MLRLILVLACSAAAILSAAAAVLAYAVFLGRELTVTSRPARVTVAIDSLLSAPARELPGRSWS